MPEESSTAAATYVWKDGHEVARARLTGEETEVWDEVSRTWFPLPWVRLSKERLAAENKRLTEELAAAKTALSYP